MFILARKVKSKWYGVAGTEASCLAAAEDKFIAAMSGIDKRAFMFPCPTHTARYGDIETQKNYGGRLPEFRIID